MTVPPALLSHESTERYTPQYILDAVIACMSAINLDPCSNSRERPNVPAARQYTSQDNGLVQLCEACEAVSGSGISAEIISLLHT